MKTVTFYYVRHGETLFNVQNRMQGWCDSPLTEKGIQNAKDAGKILADVDLDYAWTSTSERCRDTCAIILRGRDIPVYESKGLKEVNFGTWEAVKVDEHLEEINRRRTGGIRWDDCGGDSWETFSQRITKTYKEIYDQAKDGDHILIVSHGAHWLWLQKILLGIDSETFGKMRTDKGLSKLPNGFNGIFECRDGKYRLLSSPGLSEEEINSLYQCNTEKIFECHIRHSSGYDITG